MLERLRSWWRGEQRDTTVISSPARWLFEAFGASPTASGISVTREKAQTYSAWWAALNIISSDVARLPLSVFRRTDDGDRIKDRTHPLYRVLHDRPNPEMTSYTWRRTMQAQVLTFGNGLSWIDRSMPDLRLWPIDWNTVQLDRDRSTRELVYRISTDSGTVTLRPDEVLHIKGLSNDGLVGISVIHAAAQSVGHGLAMQRFGALHFKNGASPKVIFTVPKTADKAMVNEFIDDFQKKTSGEKAHLAFAIKEPFTATPLATSAKDSQLIEAMGWSVRDVANWFPGLPPHLLGDSSRTAYNSLAQENQSYLNRCLNPHLTNWEAELMMKLAPDDDSIIIEHERRAVLDLDIVSQTDVFDKALNKWLTAAEIRRFLNLPPQEMPRPQPAAPVPEGGDDED